MERKETKRIGLLTGGGDCPGLNAVIRSVVKSGLNLGWEVYGIREGFEGLLKSGRICPLRRKDVAGILHVGGTILGTTNRGNPFAQKTKDGRTVDLSNQVVKRFHSSGFDALIVIGGDGTLSIAKKLYDKGVPLVGIPKTIDNDLSGTVITFGFDTAVSTATEALDKLHSTAKSHQRVMVVEVMGRYAGWIALNSGVSGGADIILIPEIPFKIEAACKKVLERYRRKRNFCIVVVAEGAKPVGGEMFTKECKETGRVEPLLGGVGQWVAEEIGRRTGKETRSLVLGHLQRGGQPTTFDRLTATRFGVAAVELVAKKKFGQMVALRPPNIESVPIAVAIAKRNLVPLNSDVIKAARALGVCFGDEKTC